MSFKPLINDMEITAIIFAHFDKFAFDNRCYLCCLNEFAFVVADCYQTHPVMNFQVFYSRFINKDLHFVPFFEDCS